MYTLFSFVWLFVSFIFVEALLFLLSFQSTSCPRCFDWMKLFGLWLLAGSLHIYLIKWTIESNVLLQWCNQSN